MFLTRIPRNCGAVDQQWNKNNHNVMLQTHNNEPIHNSENKIQKPNVKLPDNIDPFVHSTDRKVNHLECKAVAPFGHIEPLF